MLTPTDVPSSNMFVAFDHFANRYKRAPVFFETEDLRITLASFSGFF